MKTDIWGKNFHLKSAFWMPSHGEAELSLCSRYQKKRITQMCIWSQQPILLSPSVRLPAVPSPLPACLLSSNLKPTFVTWAIQGPEAPPEATADAVGKEGGYLARAEAKKTLDAHGDGHSGLYNIHGRLVSSPRPKREEMEARILPTFP